MKYIKDRQQIEYITQGRVVRMVSRGETSLTFLDNIDAYDIAYDAAVAGGVDVYLDTQNKVHVRYHLAACTMDEIDVTPIEKEWYELQSIVIRLQEKYGNDQVIVEASNFYKERNIYDIILRSAVGFKTAYVFNGVEHLTILGNGTARTVSFDDLKFYCSHFGKF